MGRLHPEAIRDLRLSRTQLSMSLAEQRDTYELFTRSAGELLDAWFESDALKGAYGFDAVVGNYASPCAPGSAYVLLHHCFGEVNGRKGAWGHALGGMGSITLAMSSPRQTAMRRTSGPALSAATPRANWRAISAGGSCRLGTSPTSRAPRHEPRVTSPASLSSKSFLR